MFLCDMVHTEVAFLCTGFIIFRREFMLQRLLQYFKFDKKFEKEGRKKLEQEFYDQRPYHVHILESTWFKAENEAIENVTDIKTTIRHYCAAQHYIEARAGKIDFAGLQNISSSSEVTFGAIHRQLGLDTSLTPDNMQNFIKKCAVPDKRNYCVVLFNVQDKDDKIVKRFVTLYDADGQPVALGSEAGEWRTKQYYYKEIPADKDVASFIQELVNTKVYDIHQPKTQTDPIIGQSVAIKLQIATAREKYINDHLPAYVQERMGKVASFIMFNVMSVAVAGVAGAGTMAACGALNIDLSFEQEWPLESVLMLSTFILSMTIASITWYCLNKNGKLDEVGAFFLERGGVVQDYIGKFTGCAAVAALVASAYALAQYRSASLNDMAIAFGTLVLLASLGAAVWTFISQKGYDGCCRDKDVIQVKEATVNGIAQMGEELFNNTDERQDGQHETANPAIAFAHLGNQASTLFPKPSLGYRSKVLTDKDFENEESPYIN